MLNQILYTACVTPFKNNGTEIDYKSLEKSLRLQEAAGNGIVLFGSTGEGLSISDFERRAILESVSKLDLKTEIIIGVPSYNLELALEWINFCNDFKISGYLMTTPIYTKPGIDGQTKWFEILLNKSKYPSMLYNIPGRSGIKLHSETVQNLKDHDKFVAIKDSSGIVDSLIEYKIVAPNIVVYCGDDNMMPPMGIEGACGLVSVISNALPSETRSYVEQSLRCEKFIDKIWWQACKSLYTTSNPISIKALMKDIGVIEFDDIRLPLSLNDLTLNNRRRMMEFYKMLKK